MVFSSLSFIFIFLPVFLVLYYCVPQSFQNAVLFAGSLIFYALGEPFYLFLILCSVLVNYIIGISLEKCDCINGNTKYKRHTVLRKFIFLLSMIYNFGMLVFFKYTNFFIDNINALLELYHISPLGRLSIDLPLGISFYTFQVVSYVTDVYKRKIKPEHSITDLGAYICMFPQLIAGPIIVYSDIKSELKSRNISIYNIDRGLKTFIIGLGYKVLIANRIGTLWNEVCTLGYEGISTPLAWMGAFAYSMQLYFDFCGYSVMAVGLGTMLGFTIPSNFDTPYMARSVTDFWRRWHITLGAWIREYIYIPLGGNRRGSTRTVFNLLAAWLFTGLWHGAAWNFILWGLFIFVLQVTEKKLTLGFLNRDGVFSRIVSHIYILFYILISWSIFAITDLEQLGMFLGRLFPFFGAGRTLNARDFIMYLSDYAILIVISIIFATGIPEKLYRKISNSVLGILIALVIFWCSVYFLSLGANNPFLYFRF